ncbi:hypothetical protein NDU88_001731 [Pleurodeles waltl]|uniref:Uncharacterized protein n=1 Tax=Pleurodeles waltl TaxID=8319 RepID=A0AAV7VZS9_PLEWA|nr:hypothetical protein NDU88_001731 [Pleurodeles waltl]
MGWPKRTDRLQGNTMEQYTTPVPLPQPLARSGENGDNMRVPANPEEPSRAELLAAIQGSRVALEGKIETVAVEVNLLRAELWKVSDKVKVAEGSIVELQTESSRKGFMEVKAKLRAMNVRYMLLYSARLKVISGGRSHFFNRPEEVWRLLEMWDKAVPGEDREIWRRHFQASGAESPDWRSCEADQLVDAGTGGTAEDTSHRVEIQQDGTMVVVSTGLSGGRDVEQG